LHFQERSVRPAELFELISVDVPLLLDVSLMTASDLVSPDIDMRLTFFISSYSFIITSPEKRTRETNPMSGFGLFKREVINFNAKNNH